MLIIGLTGSIGMGKSTAAKRFVERGVPVFDADAAVHRLYEGKAVPLIEQDFPGTIQNGRVDREKLARALAGDAKRIKKLESIVHPLVRAKREAFLKYHHEAGAAMVVLEIPLLFETGSQRDVDVTIVVSAPAEVQRERVLMRENMTQEKLDALLANQLSDEEKRARADFVVDTTGPIQQTWAEIDKIIEPLKGRRGLVYSRATNG